MSQLWPSLSDLKNKRVTQQVSDLFRAVSARYPGSALGPESVEAFRADWERMIRDVGVARFSLGLQKAVLSTSFFPALADINKHIPKADIGYTGWVPSAEDRKRMAAGERCYGKDDILALWKMFLARRAQLKRPLTQQEQFALMAELDARKDSVMGKTA